MDLPRYHRLRSAYYRLEGQRCTHCGHLQFPSREACGKCRERSLEPHRFSGRGKVYAYTEVAQAPSGFSAPYVVAMIDLEEGIKLTAQLTDVTAQEVKVGMEVEMVTRRLQTQGELGYLVYGYKFRPRLQRAS